MARKSSKIKCLTNKDREIRTMGQKTGWFTSNQANQLNGISKSRLDKLVNSNILAKSIDVKYGECYKVLDKTDCRGGFYHRSSTPRHDIKLTDRYLQMSCYERQHCYTADYYFNNHSIEVSRGAPDLIVLTETQEIIFLEAITENYTNQIIQEKEEVAIQCGATLEKF